MEHHRIESGMTLRHAALLQRDLKRVVETMHNEEDHLTPYRDTYRTLLDNHGKMIRASLALVFSYAAAADTTTADKPQPAPQRVIRAAAALEMLHLATLVHDDVLDSAPIRRGEPTVQVLHGNKAAIYLGDLILARYMEIMADVAPDTAFLAHQAHTVGEIVSGDLLQESARHNTSTTKTHYVRAITGKTAALFRLACTTGLTLGSADGAVCSKTAQQQAANFGENLGVAFQIADDIEDFNVGHDTGKPKLEDIRDGIYTLPVLLALQSDCNFEAIVRQDDPQAVLAYLDEHPQFIEQSRDEAKSRLQAAKQAVNGSIDAQSTTDVDADTAGMSDAAVFTDTGIAPLLNKLVDKFAATL